MRRFVSVLVVEIATVIDAKFVRDPIFDVCYTHNIMYEYQMNLKNKITQIKSRPKLYYVYYLNILDFWIRVCS